jgi:uncharacterized protein
MTRSRTYPHGVTCWIDTEQPDPVAAAQFYAGLFGWNLTEAMPPGAPGSYLIADLNGADVAGLGSASSDHAAVAVWNTYLAVDDADASAAAVRAAGGCVVSEPQDAGPGGRAASCLDPTGAAFRLWQARRRLGAQLVNSPGSWNFSDLYSSDVDAASAFYASVFGWRVTEPVPGTGAMIQVPGYGDHLAATVDPDIHERQAGAPPGFADVIGGLLAVDPGENPRWEVTFTVADRDDSATTAAKLGAEVLSSADETWTKYAVLRDPQGAQFRISQFDPPAGLY